MDRVYEEADAVGTELAGHAALFQGDYKIVRNRGPVGDGEWRLYDIARDPGETTDLSGVQPARLQRMLSRYHEYVKRNGVLPIPVRSQFPTAPQLQSFSPPSLGRPTGNCTPGHPRDSDSFLPGTSGTIPRHAGSTLFHDGSFSLRSRVLPKP